MVDINVPEKGNQRDLNGSEPLNNDTSDQVSPETASRFGWLKVLGIVLAATIISTVIAVWAVTSYMFPKELKPVTLSAKEETALEAKIERLNAFQQPSRSSKQRSQSTEEMPLEPERYDEEAAGRDIVLSEREVNALLAKNTDLAKKLAIDLSDDLASMKLLLPLDEDLPVVGGKTLKVTAGLRLAYVDGRPVVALKGISVWGVPLPNAWLGNLKNVDLVKEFGGEEGFWRAFAAGVEEIKVEEGSLRFRLKE